MSKLMQGFRASFNRAGRFVAFTFVALLAACGGGGGDTGLPAPYNEPPQAVITVSPPDGGTISTMDAVSVKVENVAVTGVPVVAVCGSTSGTASFNAAGNVEVKPPASGWEATSCEVSATIDGRKFASRFVTERPVLRYGEKVYALWNYAYPYLVDKTGTKTKVLNATSYTTGGLGIFPLINCGYAPKQLDGRLPLRCTDTAKLVLVTVYINPENDTMYDWTEPVPADWVWTYVQTDGAHRPYWGHEVALADGGHLFTYGGSGGEDMLSLYYEGVDGAVTLAVRGTAEDMGVRALIKVAN